MTARATSRRRNPSNAITRDGSTVYVYRMSKEEDRVARSRAAYFAGNRTGYDKAPRPWAVYAVPAGAQISHLWRQELGRFATATEARAFAATCAVPDFTEQLADLARRQAKEARRRNPDLAYGRGPIPPRVAQAAAAILGWAETERIVGPGLLSGASGYDLHRLVHAAKVERERQGGKPAITRRKKKNPARRALIWHPVGGGHIATHGDTTYTLARTTRAFSFTGGEKIPVWTVTVQTADRRPYEVTAAWPLSEAKTRANTHAGTTVNKWKPAKGWQPNPRRRNPAPTPQMVTADDVWRGASGFAPRPRK